MNNEIFMGLDPGTDSVGWAVTNEKYNLVKKNGKSLWGVYMFEEANPQKDRRTHRSNARRLKRRKERICLLQDLFEKEMNEVDPTFFKRLNFSFCKLEDKDSNIKYNLFADDNFTDKDFYKLYPTIYHLRRHLLYSDEKIDIRLLYLVLHHMVKYRGHFTFEGQAFNVENIDVLSLFEDLNELISDDLFKFNLTNVTNDSIFLTFLSSKGISNTKETFKELLGVKKEKNLTSIISLICGGIVKIADIFENDEYKDLDKLSFNSSDLEDVLNNLEVILEDDMNVIFKCKAIYDLLILKRLLGNQPSLTEAML